jgi:hypothetical protein
MAVVLASLASQAQTPYIRGAFAIRRRNSHAKSARWQASAPSGAVTKAAQKTSRRLNR